MKEEGYKKLFLDFPEIPTSRWEEKIKEDLKGADYKKKLVWQTDEGFDVNPYYREEDIASLAYLKNIGQLKSPGSAPNSWTICQDIFPGNDMLSANDRIHLALKGGAQAIRIHLQECPNPNSQILTAS